MRSTHLGPAEIFRLDNACKPISEAFGTDPYLVGSVHDKPDYRDVDIRLILPDKRFKKLWKAHGQPGIAMLNIAFGAYLREATGLPIDFQIQQMTAANEKHGGKWRNPMGGRTLASFPGDAEPIFKTTTEKKD